MLGTLMQDVPGLPFDELKFSSLLGHPLAPGRPSTASSSSAASSELLGGGYTCQGAPVNKSVLRGRDFIFRRFVGTIGGRTREFDVQGM